MDGRISSSWEVDDASVSLKATIPANRRAMVYVPNNGLKDIEITEGERIVWKDAAHVANVPEIGEPREYEDSVVFAVGSGTYSFTLTGA